MVQAEMNRRKTMPSRYSGTGIFASRIICGKCGGYYGAKVWHSTSKYRRVIYQCNNRFKGDDKCATPHLDEETIKRMFITAVNKLISERDEILANLKTLQETLFDKTDIDLECADLQSEMAVIAEIIQKCIDENSRVTQNQNEYRQRYDRLSNRFETANRRFEEVENLRSEKKVRRDMVEAFIETLKKQDELVTEFDERF